jgi:hypothetical protein
MLEGRVSDARRAELELHLDGCRDCSEFLSEFAKVYAPDVQRASQVAPPTSARVPPLHATLVRRLVRVGLLSAVLDAFLGMKLAWLLASAGWWSTAMHDNASLPSQLGLYLLVSAPLSALMAGAYAWGIGRGRPWAAAVCTSYALLRLPTVVMTPLAVYVLLGLRALRQPDPPGSA